MSPFDPQKPQKPQLPKAPRTLTTSAGVTVVVKPALPCEPPPEPPPEPEEPESEEPAEAAPPSEPGVEVLPVPMPARPAHEGERDAFVRRLDTEHRKFLESVCLAEGGLSKESARDMVQSALCVAAQQFDKRRDDEDWPPKNERGWLVTIARHKASNHRREWRPGVDDGVDVHEAFCPAPDPEGTAQLAERRARFFRYLDSIPQGQAQAVLCVDVYEMKIEQACIALDLPLGTVASRLARGRQRLKELAAESRRATEAGERIRPAPRASSPPPAR